MSSMDAESSESFPANSDKAADRSHGDPQTVDFSHASTVIIDTVTNGEKAMDQKQKGGYPQNLNSEHRDNLHAISEASSGSRTEGCVENIGDEEACKDATENQRIELKEGSSENASEALESEKHDSVAASAGSSPPPSSAAPDELHMDIDAKSNSEDDNKESSEVKNDSSKEVHGSKIGVNDVDDDDDGDDDDDNDDDDDDDDDDDGGGDDDDDDDDDDDEDEDGDKTDTEEGEDEVQKKEKMEDINVSDKAEDKAVDTADKKEGSAKRVLPKWMVQDADAPPSPKEETDEKHAATVVTENEPTSGARGRGRGRKGRDAARAVVKPHNEAAAEHPQPESLVSGRPRRSTRSNVDYAHPDVATVVAEQEDLENEFQLQQKVSRSRGRGRGRGRGGRPGGRKRTAIDSDDGEDSDSEYGSHKKRKRAGSSGSRGRGRGRGRGRPSRSLGRKSNKEESDDDDEEMDLSDNDAGGSTGSGEESYKPAPSKRRAAAYVAEAHSPKTPSKKRGRAPATKTH